MLLPVSMAADAPALRAEVDRYDWYHSLDLAPGVVTPGMFDHRPHLARYPLPPDLSGKRCLDVGTMDGFWAFEMERRGAASVVAIDLDDPDDLDDPHDVDDADLDHDPVKGVRPMRKLVLVLVAAALAATLSTVAAPARADGGDTTVVVVNTKDGRFLYRVRLDLRRSNGDTVDTSNAAVAVASCDACETVAVSIQALLVFSEPSTVTPENLALAMNVDCSFCQTLASAYQFLLETGGPVHLTAYGNREVAQVRRELEAIRHEGLSIWEIQAQVDALANELTRVLATELVAAGH
jgi:hypothetical protein